MDDILTQCKPVVSKGWLHLTAGIMWSAVGIVLMNLAVRWLRPLDFMVALPFALAGVLLALIFFYFQWVDALKRSLIVSSGSIAPMAVVVDPSDDEAISFYKKYGFITPQDSGKMFLPMATIAKAFE